MVRRAPAFAALVLFLASALGATRAQPQLLVQDRDGVVEPHVVTLREASRDDRWLGVGVRDVRWAPDGSAVYFRWPPNPTPDDDPDADPWYRVDRRGRSAERVPDSLAYRVPGDDLDWSADGHRAVWVRDGTVWLYDASNRHQPVRPLYAAEAVRSAELRADGLVHVVQGEAVVAVAVGTGAVRQLTAKHVVQDEHPTEAAEWLEAQQRELFQRIRDDRAMAAAAAARERRAPLRPQLIPVAERVTIQDPRVSPEGRWVTFTAVRRLARRHSVTYAEYVNDSGYVQAESARPKVGEPRDEVRLGIIPWDPTVDPDSIVVTWVEPAEAEGRDVVVHGPFWSLEGDRAVVEVRSLDYHDRWISLLDPATGATTVLDHQHDDAWIGGPDPVNNYLGPGLIAWLPGGRLVFASERTGWSHLYLAERDGAVRALTSGDWEVRGATLSRDRATWLIRASREHPSDDHLYTMPAAGGELTRLTSAPGRHEGTLSPDGRRLAVVSSDNTHLPDLWLREARPGDDGTRITRSGTAHYRSLSLITPDVVQLEHPDGGPVWAAIYRPEHPNGAAIVHTHGGGYRQFAHHGWSVYGWETHVGILNRLAAEGYTVLDFDYRGSSGYGRDYRTDIYRSMGHKDVDGVLPFIDYLVQHDGIDRDRIGVFGLSYGGFFTLMALFRHPGVFAAGIADAAVSDWAHYNDLWTSRVLGLPYDDPDAYETSSPIYFADGLADPLLIVHGLIDDNVQFQDAARLMQRLIELEKGFEVMVYPMERHVIRTEASRWDYFRRVEGWFGRWLGG